MTVYSLCQAAEQGDSARVKALLLGNPTNDDGQTALHFFAKTGHKDAVQLLLTCGADVNAKDRTGSTPLHVAAISGHKHVAELLLAKNAEMDVKNSSGLTALHLAASWNRLEVVELLLTKEVDVHSKDDKGRTALDLARSQSNSAVAQALCQRGEIHHAARNGEVQRIGALLKNDPTLVLRIDNEGSTPLHFATESDHKDAAQLLLTCGADVNAKDKWGYTPLHVAAREGREDLAELLLANHAEVDAKDNDGNTPLHRTTIIANYGQRRVAALAARPRGKGRC